MIISEKIKTLRKKADRLDFEIFDAERALDSMRDKFDELEDRIAMLEKMIDLEMGQAVEKDGLVGVVLYSCNEVVRIALRWWDGGFVEEWLRPTDDEFRALGFDESCAVFDEFRSAGVV